MLHADRVLGQLAAMLSRSGWVELEQSTSAGGLEQSLLRRGQPVVLTLRQLVSDSPRFPLACQVVSI
ncbi:hypothetical protein [Goodfellowiella coeruleoviolacea]|uniref:Uncharacterized protein n=1 Tax=Goodfellowiella coeruleoviolacea TaxID=334858 RepID=A0AAE3GGZ1_9PSEU|nr:hypothetical protein [Goodfellowiella coeruleoviolacea]MCP2167114.1 hypothetical protein [Goodfellowiella coeruleoviolacea]